MVSAGLRSLVPAPGAGAVAVGLVSAAVVVGSAAALVAQPHAPLAQVGLVAHSAVVDLRDCGLHAGVAVLDRAALARVPPKQRHRDRVAVARLPRLVPARDTTAAAEQPAVPD